MESDNLDNGPAGAGSRWNPTKEQINMLESLYMQGLRTPSAEQIQQITNRLTAFGHIQGKNVFYWFQNHKARQRQRQKQKQDNIASSNRFPHKNPVLQFPPCYNVVYSPCSRQPPPQANLGLHQQYSKLPLHGDFKRRLIPENECPKYNRIMHPRSINQLDLELVCRARAEDNTQETLDLFPIRPTGILRAKTGISTDEENSTPSTSSSSGNDCLFGNPGGNCGQNFFDFFCGNGSH